MVVNFQHGFERLPLALVTGTLDSCIFATVLTYHATGVCEKGSADPFICNRLLVIMCANSMEIGSLAKVV